MHPIRPLFVVVALVGACAGVRIDAAGAAREVVPIAEVTAIPVAALEATPPMTVVGVVIEAAPGGGWIVLEDEGGGIRVELSAAAVDGAADVEADSEILPGDEIEVEGRVEPGPFAPSLRARRIVRRGHRGLPPPRRVDTDALFEGSEHCRLAEIEGIVQQVWRDGEDVRFEIESSGRLLDAVMPWRCLAEDHAEGLDDLQLLVDSVVRVAGRVATLCNARGEIVRPVVHVDRSELFTIVTSARTFTASAVTIESLARYQPRGAAGHRVQTFGTVVHAIPGHTLHVQNGHHGVTVRLGRSAIGSAERFVPGDLVEVAGFIDRSGPVASIRSAAVRRGEHRGPPPPLVVTPGAILRAAAAASAEGPERPPGDYDGCLVRTPGELVQSQPTVDGGILVVGWDSTLVDAEADAATFRQLAGLEPGSFLSLVGVAQIDWGDPSSEPGRPERPRRLRLILRDAADVGLVRRPPWWTPLRLATFLIATAVVLTAALAWGLLLRRQLGRQKQLLATEVRSRRDAAVEYEATLRERNRLAANLHDTLQQTIGGIGFQLDACAAGGGEPWTDTRRHLAVARRMVHHAAQELQSSVWAMRSLTLGGKPFVETLREVVARVGDGHDAAIAVEVTGTFDGIPEFVAGNLLLLVQEAVHNALRHGRPSRIVVSVSGGEEGQGGEGLVVRVEDDGRGFTVGGQAGPSEGHFGIHGMRERAERLGGSLSIHSRPGAGTTVEAIVQRRDYDDAIDPRRETRGRSLPADR